MFDNTKKLEAIDLFAGIGGIRISFENIFKEKMKVVFSSEIDKFARQTYFDNFNELPHGDITQINENDIPKHNILLAGFPCQAFSIAGHRKGFNDTRGTLFFDVTRIVKKHKPEVIFLENVKDFKNHDKGRTFNIVKNTLENMGYDVFSEVLNARNFGIPQNRERIYIVAFLKNKFKKISFNFNELKNITIKSKLGDILEKNVDEKYTISDRLWAGHQRRKLEHKKKVMGLVILYLIITQIILALLVLDIIKMGLKY